MAALAAAAPGQHPAVPGHLTTPARSLLGTPSMPIGLPSAAHAERNTARLPAAAPAVAAATAALLALSRRRQSIRQARGRGGRVLLRAEDTVAVKEKEEESTDMVQKPPAGQIVKRELNDRQQQFWEMLEEDFEDEVVPEFGREALERVFEFMKYCKYEKEIPELPELQEIDPEFFPGLRAKPWWEVEELPDNEWVEKVNEGLPYVQGELADLLEDNEELMITDSVKNDVMGGGWSGFRLQRLGDWMLRNCEMFPKTVQLLKESEVPLAMRGVIVARQVPCTGVNPHSDGRNFFLTAHFGLSIPPDCDMTVGGETRPWKEDDAIIVDTSFIHSTRNQSDEDRFVLIVDFWHPDLTVPEQEALEFIYDFRTKFEQGKIKYVPKMPTDFFETLELYSAWGGAYTEEKIIKQPDLPDTLGGFRLGG